MFVGIGVIQLFVGIVIGLLIDTENVTIRVNGVARQATSSEGSNFRLLFLLIFGILGIVLTTIGIILSIRMMKRKKENLWLKQSGKCVLAEVTSYESTGITVNDRRLPRVYCRYIDDKGRTYIFKSGALRTDPSPYLTDNQIKVYYDRQDISNYFVDIDGSVGLGTKVFEL